MDARTSTPDLLAFHDLYQRYAGEVYRFAYSLSGERAEAEDICSETFARAWMAVNDLNLETVKGYLLTIARNLYFEGRRRSKRRAELNPEMPDPARGPHHAAESEAELERALGLLRTFPAADREVFLLRVRDGLSYEEIARIHGISAGSAKVKVHRIRLKLIKQREEA